MKYDTIWNSVDKLAQSKGLSPSGLAKLAGLDATTFNKSKRIRPDGKNRWPSMDSVNKLLEVCNITFEQFYNMGNSEEEFEGGTIPFIKLSQLGCNPKIEDKYLKTAGWNKIIFPDAKDILYAAEINTDEYLPLYHHGSTVILSANSDIRKGDRVAIFLNEDKLLLKEFIRRTPSQLVITDINNPAEEKIIAIADVKLINRILWASQ